MGEVPRVDLTYEVVVGGQHYTVKAEGSGDGRIGYRLEAVDREGNTKVRLTGELSTEDLPVVAELIAATFNVLSTGQPTTAPALADLRRIHPNAYEKWTAEEEEHLVDAFRSGTVVRDLAVEFGRRPSAIRTRLIRLGEIESSSTSSPSTTEELDLGHPDTAAG